MLKPEYVSIVIYTFYVTVAELNETLPNVQRCNLFCQFFFVGYGCNFILAAIISPAEDFYLMSELMTPFSRSPHFDCKPALIQMTIFIVTVLLYLPAPAFNGELSLTKNT